MINIKEEHFLHSNTDKVKAFFDKSLNISIEMLKENLLDSPKAKFSVLVNGKKSPVAKFIDFNIRI